MRLKVRRAGGSTGSMVTDTVTGIEVTPQGGSGQEYPGQEMV